MTTPLDTLIATVTQAGDHNPEAERAPEAIVWCDRDGEFAPLLPLLRARIPQLLTLGEPDPATRTGPALWLRAAVSGALPDLALPDDRPPVLYLPGVGREILRGAEDCPPLLQPLVWFTVSGVLFGHVNGKDWTLRGFLSAGRGPLRLDVADDAATRAALALAAVRLMSRPLDSIRTRRWDADALHALLAPDLIPDMLAWMDGSFDPEREADRFTAFAHQAARELAFDPRRLSRQDAARRLIARRDRWEEVWTRFAAQPTGHDGVVALLGREEPADLLADREPYPRLNAGAETALRKALTELAELSESDARARLLILEQEHGRRRDTVWARRGEAPLAQALASLAVIAAAGPLPAHDADALAGAYCTDAWKVDDAALRALMLAPRDADRHAVTAALRAVYLPWLDAAARALQDLARADGVPFARPEPHDGPDTLLFVDALRMDLAHELVRRLQGQGVSATLTWVWSGFPTITATCKPLVSPIADRLSGQDADEAQPVDANGQAADKRVLYKGLAEAGWGTEETLVPEGRHWAETGRFDEDGHALGARLVDQIEQSLRNTLDDVLRRTADGRPVRIVTDHGWLLLPGGLPKAAGEPGLFEPEQKYARYAAIRPGAQTASVQVPWSWNAEIRYASASGAAAFYTGQDYVHGGISPQECVLPVIDIAGGTPQRRVSVTQITWEGLRLRVVVSGGADLRVDLRLGPDTGGPSLLSGQRSLDGEGRAAMLVTDEHEGRQACLVVLGDDDMILANRLLTIGTE